MFYLSEYNTESDFNSVSSGLSAPHVAVIYGDNDNNKVNYIGLNNTIRYTASAKLNEANKSAQGYPYVSGLHTDSFGGLKIIEHTFADGVGIIKFNGKVTTIAANAFWACSSITNIMLPNRVESIGSGAFYGCTRLESITCRAMTAPTCYTETFRDVKTDGTLYVPQGSSGYDSWMSTSDYFLGKYNWTKVEQ